MGTFRHTIAIESPDQSRSVEIKAVVDTGATYTWIPRQILESLGISPAVRRRLKMADGVIIEREAASVPIRLNGETLPTLCIFGDEGSEPLLGALTLEEFSLGVDPVNRKLVPIISLLL